MIIDAHATDTVPSHEVRQRANEALTNAGEPMSEVTYDALRKRIAELEAALRFATEYVGRLASTLAKKHYPDQQHFELHPHLLGRIDQIDNMTCGLHRAALRGGEDD